MAGPEVLILTLKLGAHGRRLLDEVTSDVPDLLLVVELSEPWGPQMPRGSWAADRPVAGLQYYIDACQCLFIILYDWDAIDIKDLEVIDRLLGERLLSRHQRRRSTYQILLRDEPSQQFEVPPRPWSYINRNDFRPIRLILEWVMRPPRPDGADDRPRLEEVVVLHRPQKQEVAAVSHDDWLVKYLKYEEQGSVPTVPEDISCSVYAPRLAAPGDEILVQAFAHEPGREREVAAMSAAADPTASAVGVRQLAEPVAEGDRVGFHFSMRGAEIDDPDQELVWRGRTLAAQFSVHLPEDSRPRSAVGAVTVTKNGVPVGHVKFTLLVVDREEKIRAEAAGAEMLGALSRYRQAFISYASKDREKVLPRVQALAAARIKVFQDFSELEPGERWERGLYKHIDECDVFFLFWSQAARDSEWVRKEAEYARARQAGSEDSPPEIIPIIIEGPPPPKPPPELDFLHFNDKYLYLMKGVEAEAEARRGERT